MKRFLAPIVLLTLLLGTSAFSADFQKGLTTYNSGDYATALRQWKPLAEQGDAGAQYKLGVMYMYGEGIPKDYKTAVKWYRLAAEQGFVSAQNNLGMMYYKGRGVPQDYKTALMWLNIIAASGDKLYVYNRNLIAKRMTPSKIAEAQKLARECVRKKYKGC